MNGKGFVNYIHGFIKQLVQIRHEKIRKHRKLKVKVNFQPSRIHHYLHQNTIGHWV